MQKFFKKHPDLKKLFGKKLNMFQGNPKDPRLDTHKLQGELGDLWAFSIDHSYRILFSWQGETIWLVNIGTHDEVY